MCASATIKLGLFIPPTLHLRMVDASRGVPACTVQASYAEAFVRLLDSIDAGEEVIFAAVRGDKQRVTVRLTEALSQRLRVALERLNLKITDFACAAVERHLNR